MNEILQKVRRIGIVPVVVLHDAKDAVPLAEALCGGGLPCAEVTFRTEAARDAIREMKRAFPQMLLAAGTVLTAEQADQAAEAGAEFIVSPGFDPEVVDHCLDRGLTVLPGCITPSEAAQAVKRGLEVVKFFPAEQAGGLKMIQAMAAPYTTLSFMPTGGISQANVRSYLEYDRIWACGGSWMVKDTLIRGGRFEEIRRMAEEAAAVVREVRGQECEG